MRTPPFRTFALAGSVAAVLVHAVAQQPAPAPAVPDFSPSPAPASQFVPETPSELSEPEALPPGRTKAAKPRPSSAITPASPTLFPSGAESSAPVPDFAAPASAFGVPSAAPDFSRSSTSGTSAAPAGGTGSSSGGRGGGATIPGGGTGLNGGATGGQGFVPGPFSSPASTTPTTPNGVAAPASVFGTGALGSSTGLGAGSGTGTAGLGGANTRTPNPSTPTSFSLPGSYGQAPLTFSAGQGRLARPRYVYTGTFQVGFDDNILQTPTAQNGLPAQYQTVQTQVEIPDREILVLVPPTGPAKLGVKAVPVYRTEVIKGQEARFERVLVSPESVPQERVGSFVARSGLGFEMQLSNSRTVFTADAHVSFDYYLDRPGDQSDINGNVSFIYAHRYSSRLQFSATVSAAYLSQPDLRVVSGPTRQVGDYFTYNSKFDLSYQWAKHFSTVSSLSLSALSYSDEIQQLNDSYSAVIGTELRYSYSPRLTLVGEVRVGGTFYPSGSDRNSNTYFLLAGADFAYSRRLSGTIRAGASLRTFETGGDSATSPYVEATAAYRFSPTGTLSWSSRYGFEEPQDANSEVVVFRTSLNAVQAFTARLRGNVSVGYIHRLTSQDQSINNYEITGDTYTADIGLDYALTRKLSINASYSFINDLSSLESTGYYRNQIFVGAQYTF